MTILSRTVGNKLLTVLFEWDADFPNLKMKVIYQDPSIVKRVRLTGNPITLGYFKNVTIVAYNAPEVLGNTLYVRGALDSLDYTEACGKYGSVEERNEILDNFINCIKHMGVEREDDELFVHANSNEEKGGGKMEKEVRVIEDTLDSIPEGTLKLAVTGLDQKDLAVYLNSETNEVTIIYKDDNNRKNYKTFCLSEFYSATVEYLMFKKGILTLKVTYDIGKKLEIAVPKTLTETEK